MAFKKRKIDIDYQNETARCRLCGASHTYSAAHDMIAVPTSLSSGELMDDCPCTNTINDGTINDDTNNLKDYGIFG